LAVKEGEVATPEALVFTLAVVAPPANVPLAPEAGAVKVTVAAETRLPPESFTVTISGLLKRLLTCALWPPPDVAMMVAAAPGVFVSAKEAGLDTLAADAVTV
jgi:hypothetical protein